MFIVEVRTLLDSEVAYVTTSIDKAVELVIKDGQDWYDNADYCFYVWQARVDSIDCFDDADNAYYIDLKGNLSRYNPLYL